MHRTSLKTMIAGISLPLALGLGVAPALAHGGPHGAQYALTKGTVLSFTNGTLQVQTQTGTVSFAVTSATHVIRQVSGTTNDLQPKVHVSAHLVKGTTTAIDAIRIDPAHTAQTTHTHVAGSKHSTSQTKPAAQTKPAHSTWASKAPGAATEVSGDVVSATSGSVTLLDHHSAKMATYTLSNATTITKVVSGSQTDLAQGEMVQVIKGHSGTTVAIIILNA